MIAEELKKAMLLTGIASQDADMSWLTDEFIANHATTAKLHTGRTGPDGKMLIEIDYGNHFFLSNNGARWNWTSGENVTGGNLNCGTSQGWYYDRRAGDSYVIRGRCPAGYDWYEFSIGH